MFMSFNVSKKKDIAREFKATFLSTVRSTYYVCFFIDTSGSNKYLRTYVGNADTCQLWNIKNSMELSTLIAWCELSGSSICWWIKYVKYCPKFANEKIDANELTRLLKRSSFRSTGYWKSANVFSVTKFDRTLSAWWAIQFNSSRERDVMIMKANINLRDQAEMSKLQQLVFCWILLNTL